ncbi:UNVERIFIED_CONTAM: hypothetical protein Slati_3431400 [Sesamum latifolium]|uniref:Uncharacterized protein n=1 Tax=Sesamum latifolium TaxID=2727402 RepID=A0AAW2UID4_9LAMI
MTQGARSISGDKNRRSKAGLQEDGNASPGGATDSSQPVMAYERESQDVDMTHAGEEAAALECERAWMT